MHNIIIIVGANKSWLYLAVLSKKNIFCLRFFLHMYLKNSCISELFDCQKHSGSNCNWMSKYLRQTGRDILTLAWEILRDIDCQFVRKEAFLSIETMNIPFHQTVIISRHNPKLTNIPSLILIKTNKIPPTLGIFHSLKIIQTQTKITQ